MNVSRSLVAAAAALAVVGAAGMAASQDNAPLNPIASLKPLGAAWLPENPYRGDVNAAGKGHSVFANNCARCHGIDAISGGIAPDLRYLPKGAEGDAIFAERVQKGAQRDGRVLMPPMAPTLGQQQLWAVRTWLESVHEE